MYPEGEEWEVEPENLRAGHPQEASGFGMLNIELAPPAVSQSMWRLVNFTSVLALSVKVSSSMVPCSETVQCSKTVQCSNAVHYNNTVQCSRQMCNMPPYTWSAHIAVCLSSVSLE